MTAQNFEAATDLFMKCIKTQTEILELLSNYYKEQNINALQKYSDAVQSMLLTMKATK